MKNRIVIFVLFIFIITICHGGQKFNLNQGNSSKSLGTNGISSFQENVLKANSDEYVEYDTTESGFHEYLPKDISFGFSGFQFDYKELIELPKKSTENGFIPGGYVALTSNRNFPFFLNFGLQYAKANETYDGSTQDGIPKVATTKSTFWKFDIGLNYQFVINEDLKFIPFVWYSYRSWDRNIAEGDDSAHIEEVYSWNNLPIGCKLIYKPSPDISLGITGCANMMMSGSMSIQSSPFTFKLGTVTSYHIEFDFLYKINEEWSITINPYYEKYNFDKSNELKVQIGNLMYTIYEPSSRTYVSGASVGAILKF